MRLFPLIHDPHIPGWRDEGHPNDGLGLFQLRSSEILYLRTNCWLKWIPTRQFAHLRYPPFVANLEKAVLQWATCASRATFRANRTVNPTRKEQGISGNRWLKPGD
jgi:hypothetical protein